MGSILNDLYNGRVYPAEQFSPKIEQYRRLVQEQKNHYDDFAQQLSQLDPSLRTRFIKIIDEQTATLPIEYQEMFISGFRLGARVMLEVFQDNP